MPRTDQMTLMRISKNAVASDLGFTVHRYDVYTVSYHEGDRVFKFPSVGRGNLHLIRNRSAWN